MFGYIMHNLIIIIILVWPSTKQLCSAKWPLCSAGSVSSNVSSRAFTYAIITINTITPIIVTRKKRNVCTIFESEFTAVKETRTQVNRTQYHHW